MIKAIEDVWECVTAYPEVSELIMDYDEEKIKQVVSNLLSNAIKFSEESGRVVLHLAEVISENGSDNYQLQIKVQDNGIGIPEDELPHIFERFYQVTESAERTETTARGTGIGLAIVQQLTTAMGGSVDVVNCDPGAEFSIEFREAGIVS